MPEIEDYKVLPLRLSPKATNCHDVYMREHFIRLIDHNKPKGRTLFLLNVPPYVTEESLNIFFKTIGEVVSVTFAAKPGKDETEVWQQNCTPFKNGRTPYKFKIAYVVFKSNTSVAKALKLSSIDLYSSGTREPLMSTGMQLWHNEYEKSILNEEETQTLIDKYMEDYDQRERMAQEEAKNTSADADGWVTVGKQGRGAGFEQKESVIDRLENKIQKSKKNKELTNFYTFQIRESKMKNIIELRKKFEDDKKKIEVLKQTRRFRPF